MVIDGHQGAAHLMDIPDVFFKGRFIPRLGFLDAASALRELRCWPHLHELGSSVCVVGGATLSAALRIVFGETHVVYVTVRMIGCIASAMAYQIRLSVVARILAAA